MADRRSDETPLAPRRSLGPAPASNGQPSETQRRPLSDRVSAAVASPGGAVQSPPPASSSGASTGPAAPTSGSGGASTTGSQPRQRSTGATTARRGPRKARLRVTHLDPWSVMKTAFLLSMAIGIVTVVAVAVVWYVLGAAGVWDSINKTVTDVLGGNSASTFDVKNYVGTNKVMGFTMIVAVVDVVLLTVIATLGAFLYNLAAALLGGIEVVLAEEDR